MAGNHNGPTYGKEAAMFSGLVAGVLFCALWSGLLTLVNIWGDLGPAIIAMLAAAVAAGTTAYRLGSTTFRIGIQAVFSLIGALVLMVLLALAMAPLEPIFMTVLNERPLFYGASIAFGAGVALFFGKRNV